VTASVMARRIRPRDVEVSALTFGTLRLNRAGDVRAASDLIRLAIELGVSTFHVSTEYETWPLFLAAWRRLPSSLTGEVKFMAKVAAPHFGEAGFDPLAFRTKIDGYRHDLAADRLDVVQWLLRSDLNDEKARAEIFDRDGELIGATVDALREAGVIRSLISFPYTRPIAGRALAASWCDGLALYCNPLELETIDLMDRAGSAGKTVVALRPFAAGRVFAETRVTGDDAVSFPLAHAAVASVVASLSSADHLRTAVSAAARANGEWPGRLAALRRTGHV